MEICRTQPNRDRAVNYPVMWCSYRALWLSKPDEHFPFWANEASRTEELYRCIEAKHFQSRDDLLTVRNVRLKTGVALIHQTGRSTASPICPGLRKRQKPGTIAPRASQKRTRREVGLEHALSRPSFQHPLLKEFSDDRWTSRVQVVRQSWARERSLGQPPPTSAGKR